MIHQLDFNGNDKVDKAIMRLQAYEPKEGYYLCFSGGKDSCVIKALADMAGVKYDAHYSVSSVDPPELVRFIKEVHPDVLFTYPRDKDGYLYYVLCYRGDRRTVKAHRLVAETWIPNPDNKPAVDHINGDRTDNSADNLRWVTNKENTNNPNTLPNLKKALSKRDAYAIGAIRNFGRIKTTVYKDGVLLGTFESQKAAADFYGCNPGHVSECIKGKRDHCKGYVFRSAKE